MRNAFAALLTICLLVVAVVVAPPSAARTAILDLAATVGRTVSGVLSPDDIDSQLEPAGRAGAYVALGDSFSSGEGDPYVNPSELREKYGVDTLDEVGPCTGPPVNRIGPNCIGTSREEVENDLGWLGDTGTDIDKLDEYSTANFADSYSYGGNNCHRSAHSYPARWSASADNAGWDLTFAACSGALVKHYWEGFREEPPQRAILDSQEADLVTLGFGGNDVGFGEFVRCALLEATLDRRLLGIPFIARVDSCKDAIEPVVQGRLDELRASLDLMYKDVANLVKERNGQVIAIGYPRLFPDDPPDSCGLGANASIGRDSMEWLNHIVDQINSVIRETSAANDLEYVKTTDIINAPGPDGVRHDFCIDDGAERWVNRLIPSDLRRSMHPKWQYHDQVAERVLACNRDRATCDPRSPDSIPVDAQPAMYNAAPQLIAAVEAREQLDQTARFDLELTTSNGEVLRGTGELQNAVGGAEIYVEFRLEVPALGPGSGFILLPNEVFRRALPEPTSLWQTFDGYGDAGSPLEFNRSSIDPTGALVEFANSATIVSARAGNVGAIPTTQYTIEVGYPAGYPAGFSVVQYVWVDRLDRVLVARTDWTAPPGYTFGGADSQSATVTYGSWGVPVEISAPPPDEVQR